MCSPIARTATRWKEIVIAAAFAASAFPASTATALNAGEVPFIGVLTKKTTAHCRAGRIYVTEHLSKAQFVHVEQRLLDWYKIAPPKGGESLISQAFVDLHGGGKSGVINRNRAAVRAVNLNNKANSYYTQVRLAKGATVQVKGKYSSFYTIVPPKNAYVYVHASAVDHATRQQIRLYEQTRANARKKVQSKSADPPSQANVDTTPESPKIAAGPKAKTPAITPDATATSPPLVITPAEPTQTKTAPAPATADQPSEKVETDQPAIAQADSTSSAEPVRAMLANAQTGPHAMQTTVHTDDAQPNTKPLAQPSAQDRDTEVTQTKAQAPQRENDPAPTSAQPPPVESPVTDTFAAVPETQVTEPASPPTRIATPNVTKPEAPPVTVDPTKSTSFAQAEKKFAAASQTNFDKQPVDALLKVYQKLTIDPDLTHAQQVQAYSRIRVLKHRAILRQVLQKVADAEQNAPRAPRVTQKRVKDPSIKRSSSLSFRNKRDGNVGWLTASRIYSGSPNPRLYRLVDPTTKRTIAYIRPGTIVDPASHLGRMVSLKGRKSWDKDVKLYVLDVSQIEAVRMASPVP